MNYLILEWVHEGRVQKKFRLPFERSGSIIGSSRHAEFRLSSSWLRPIEGVFEFQNGHWVYISVQGTDNNAERVLENGMEFKISEAVFKVTLQPVTEALFNKPLEKPNGPTIKMHMFAVFLKGKLIRSAVLPEGQTLALETLGGTKNLTAYPGSDWKEEAIGEYQVRSSTQQMVASNDWMKADPYKVSKKEKVIAGSALLLTALFSGVVAYGPGNVKVANIAPPRTPPVVYKEIKLPEVKKEQIAQKQQTAPSKQLAGGGSTTASVANQLRNIGLNRLIAKVSARGAASANVVIAQGREASSEKSTGRALAAIGSLAGKNWDGAVSAGKGVSTVGRGGNSTGYKSLGAMSAGNTGQAGVGLIEEESDVVGGLDREIIAQYIKSQLGQILYCYERQLSAHPELFGKVAVKFTIGPSGQVETQKIGESSLRDTMVEGCILQKVARWKFPSPEGGTRVIVTYPFLFKSTN
ncbi:MAG: TonB family protein [Pseudobdellovibrionaceae bacterium]